jgi:hypothetical protein
MRAISAMYASASVMLGRMMLDSHGQKPFASGV